MTKKNMVKLISSSMQLAIFFIYYQLAATHSQHTAAAWVLASHSQAHAHKLIEKVIYVGLPIWHLYFHFLFFDFSSKSGTSSAMNVKYDCSFES